MKQIYIPPETHLQIIDALKWFYTPYKTGVHKNYKPARYNI